MMHLWKARPALSNSLFRKCLSTSSPSPPTQKKVYIPEKEMVERVTLLDEIANRKYYAKLTMNAGGNVTLFRTSVKIQDIIDARFGKRVTGIGKNPQEYTVLPYLLPDFIVHGLSRGATPVYSKDAATIIEFLDLQPGQKVLEAGTGSGALSLYLSRQLGADGRLVTFEIREEAQDLAIQNVSLWKWLNKEKDHDLLVDVDAKEVFGVEVEFGKAELEELGEGGEKIQLQEEEVVLQEQQEQEQQEQVEEKGEVEELKQEENFDSISSEESILGGEGGSEGEGEAPIRQRLPRKKKEKPPPPRYCLSGPVRLGNIVFVRGDIRKLKIAEGTKTESTTADENPVENPVENDENSITTPSSDLSLFDCVVLDMMEPWNALENAVSMLKMGGRLTIVVPSITQVVSILEAAESRGVPLRLIKTVEVLQREWYILPPVARPAFSQINHSMFIMLAVKVEPGGGVVAASTNKKKKREILNNKIQSEQE